MILILVVFIIMKSECGELGGEFEIIVKEIRLIRFGGYGFIVKF